MFKISPARSEYVTRKQIIDAKLKAAGWSIAKFDQERPLAKYERCAIEEYPTEAGPADYVLCVGGRIAGIVEAKKLSLGPQNVLTQAERYSRGLMGGPYDFCGFHVPFLFSTNGEVIWYHDIRNELSRSREIKKFHTPDVLIEFLERDFDASIAVLRAMPNDHHRILARLYQVEANTEIEKAIEVREAALRSARKC
mgnify:CR=1 FL=1